MVQKELEITYDKSVAKELLQKLDELKRAIDKTGNSDLSSKAEHVVFKKNDTRIPAYKRNAVIRRIALLATLVLVFVGIGVVSFLIYSSNMAAKQAKYEYALSIINTDYAGARDIFYELDDYEDSANYKNACELCVELDTIEREGGMIKISALKSKLQKISEIGLQPSFEKLQGVLDQCETVYNTKWVGGEHHDSGVGPLFYFEMEIHSNDRVEAVGLRSDGYMNDALRRHPDYYDLAYSDGELCGIEDDEYVVITFHGDYVEYWAYRLVNRDIYKLYLEH